MSEDSIHDNPYIKVTYQKDKGRSIFSKVFIPRGTVVFVDNPYIANIDSLYKKNICSTCFKYFSETCRPNVVVCPQCNDYYFCSSFCKQYQKNETRHSSIECEWLQYFGNYFKHQLLEDDKNIVLLLLKIIAKRIHQNDSLSFIVDNDNSKNTDTNDSYNLVPRDVTDLIDHLDEYLSLGINNSETIEQQQQNPDTSITDSDMDISKLKSIWKSDFKKFINISRVIQHIIDRSKHQEILSVGIDSDGDMIMSENNDIENTIQTESLSKSDLNILKLLCKVRSNFFGLWHNGLQNNIVEYNRGGTPNTENDTDSNTTTTTTEHQKNIEFLWCGSAVYLSLSLFNHSCFPNCTTLLEYNNGENGVFSFNYTKTPLRFSIVTLFDIEPNQELFITYIPLNQNKKERNHQLKSSWLFECNCKRCELEQTKSKEIDELFNSVCCRNVKCKSGMVFPLANGYGVCRVCKDEFKSPTSINLDVL
ncbi:hypothetical protein DLAC_07457 [Tieghemostelium lacteum]|uniref:SET domain-containing protein n=1 Tax=Tieghemostelium lacteum TaxID=361077 RepID=A0A151ZCK9_TIELA|nr:hypothetical protein DLAC_07457 [Tieghemostelium lacteum]|eukprot:KYQ91680.1 hypothetical protein DLAC_07457 [Tieghemostelium lacteum]